MYKGGFLRVVKISELSKKEVDAKHLLFLYIKILVSEQRKATCEIV